MSELPNGWISKKLEDIVQKIDKIDPVSQSEDFSFKYIDISGIDNQSNRIVDSKELLGKDAPSRARQLVREGDILFSTVRTYLKNIAQVPNELDGKVASTGFAVLRTGLNTLNRLLYYYVLSDGFLEPLNALQRGISYPAVTNKNVLSQEILLPPLNEQKRIVAKLDKLFAHLDGLKARMERVPELLKQFRQSVLTQAVTGKLTEDWRELHHQTQPAKAFIKGVINKRNKLDPKVTGKSKKLEFKELLGPDELPKNWEYAYLQNFGELVRGKSKHRPRNDEKLFGGEYPFIQTGDVSQSNGLIENYKTTYNDFGLKQSKLFPTGTLCITIAANIAQTGILTFDSCFPDSVVGYVPFDSLYSSQFAQFYIKTIQKDLEHYAPATAQKNINLQILYEIPFPVPPLEEQQEIVRRVEALFEKADLIERQYEMLKEKIKHLPQAILSKAFRGELVPQDPNDEPAEELLERIQAEKEGRPVKSKLAKHKLKPSTQEIKNQIQNSNSQLVNRENKQLKLNI